MGFKVQGLGCGVWCAANYDGLWLVASGWWLVEDQFPMTHHVSRSLSRYSFLITYRTNVTLRPISCITTRNYYPKDEAARQRELAKETARVFAPWPHHHLCQRRHHVFVTPKKNLYKKRTMFVHSRRASTLPARTTTSANMPRGTSSRKRAQNFIKRALYCRKRALNH